MSGDPDPREELTELVRQTRAWVQWIADSGVDALQSTPSPRAPAAEAGAAEAGAAEAGAAEAGAAEASAPAAAAPAAAAPAPQPTAAVTPAAMARAAMARAAEARATEARATEARARAAAPKAASAATFERPATAEARQARLAELAEEVRNCTRCALHAARTNAAFARGNAETPLVFVGEGPGAEEDRQGLPFVGPAGQLLDKMIGAMGYARDDVYICNIVKCRPPNNRKPEAEEVAACAPYLLEQLSIVAPEVIVALGATGVQGLMGTTIGITRLRGKWKIFRGRTPIMPTFHPAYLLRQPEKKRQVWEDLQQVMQKLGKEPAAPKPTPSQDPPPQDPEPDR